MKTDAIFYELFKEFPYIFFELIGQPDSDPNIYEFTAPEIKQPDFRLDGVFSPREEFSNEPFYFVETQFYKDEQFYDRLFSSIFLYFYQYQPVSPNWYAIVIYDRRSKEYPVPLRYRNLVEPHLRRFYLNELPELEDENLGLGIVKLIVETENKSKQLGKQLVKKAQEELTDTATQQKILEFIETIFVYKFANLSREEIEAMLDLSLLRETRVFREAKEEGKLELTPKLLQKGFSIQEVADILEIDIEIIRQYLKNS